MKPEQLLQAMQEIDPAYIKEAQPKQPALSGREYTAPKKTGSSAGKTAPRRTGREYFMKNIIVQRVATAAVSAAALAVFIGGGWFIAKNAGQVDTATSPASSSLTDMNIEISADLNFLGGVGLPYPVNAGTSKSLILADETRYYSGSSWWSKTDNPAVSHPLAYDSPVSSLMEIDLISDGEHIFRIRGNEAYVLNDKGEEYLFYTAKNAWQENPISEDEIELTPTAMQDVQIREIFRFGIPDETDAQWYLVYGTCSDMTNGYSAFMTAVQIQQEGEQFTTVEEYYATSGLLAAYSNALPPITPDPRGGFWIYSEAEQKAQWLDHTLSCYAEIPLPETLRNVVILPAGNELYLCGTDSERGYSWISLKEDFNTAEIHTCPELRFRSIANAGNGNLAAISADGMSLMVMNADGTNMRTLYTITKDSPWVTHDVPTEDELFQSVGDANKEFFGIACPLTGKNGESWMQIDCETGEVRWLYEREPESPTETQEPEQQETEPAPEVRQADTNIFGGKGEIHVSYPGSWDAAPVFSDDEYFWLGGGGHYNMLSKISKAEVANKTVRLYDTSVSYECDILTDGERIYLLRDNAIYLTDSFGNETLFCENVFPCTNEFGTFDEASLRSIFRVEENGKTWYAVTCNMSNSEGISPEGIGTPTKSAIIWIDPAQGSTPVDIQFMEPYLEYKASDDHKLYALTQCGRRDADTYYGTVMRCFAPGEPAADEPLYLRDPENGGADGTVLQCRWNIINNQLFFTGTDDCFHCYDITETGAKERVAMQDDSVCFDKLISGKLYGITPRTNDKLSTALMEFDPVTHRQNTVFERENVEVTHILNKMDSYLTFLAVDHATYDTYYVFYDTNTGEAHMIPFHYSSVIEE